MTLADELEAYLAAKETTAEQMARWVFLNADAIIAALRAQAERVRVLEEALTDTLYFLERHSNRWDGVNGKHPQVVVTAARAALKAAP